VSDRNKKVFIHSSASNQFSIKDIKAILSKIVNPHDFKRYEDSVKTFITTGRIDLDIQTMKQSANLLT